MSKLLELPLEVLTGILSHLETLNLLDFCATCRHARDTFRPHILSQLLGEDENTPRCKELALKLSPLMRHHALLVLYHRHGTSGQNYDFDWLVELGASFAPIPHGMLLSELFLDNELDDDTLKFLESHGASFDAIPGGINALFEDLLRNYAEGESTDYLLARGAETSKVPAGIENVIDYLMCDERNPPDDVADEYGRNMSTLNYILIHHDGPIAYCSDTMTSTLYSELKNRGPSENTDTLLDAFTNSHQRLLEEAIRRGETMCVPYLLDSEEASLRQMKVDGYPVQTLLDEDTDLKDSSGAATVLYGAALLDDMALLNELLTKGTPVDAVEPQDRRTALHGAVDQQCHHLVRHLLAKGAEPSHRTKSGHTPLHWTATHSDTGILNDLIRAGADVNAQAEISGETTLHRAIRAQNFRAASTLLELGADPHIADKQGWAAIHVAAAWNDTVFLKSLLKVYQNADYVSPDEVSAIDGEEPEAGMTPLHVATSKGNLEAVKVLVKSGADVRKASGEGNTALHMAAEDGWEEIMRFLVAQGASVNEMNKEGLAPLHLAAAGDHDSAVGFLIDSGAEIEMAPSDKPFATPLYRAAGPNCLNAARCLIDEGAKVNPENNENITPIFAAARDGHHEMMELLIQHGASIDVANDDGFFPLHLAAMSGKIRPVRILIENGAAVDVTETNGGTPLHLAVATDCYPSLEVLLKLGADPDRRNNDNSMVAVQYAAMKGNMRLVKLLVEHNVNLETRGLQGSTALHLASDQGHLDVVRYLVQHGADVNSLTDDERTPLHSAASSGHVDVMKYLVRRGAKYNKRDQAGVTALLDACYNGHLDAVQYLTVHPDVSLNDDKDDFGRTTLHSALYGFKFDLATSLISSGCDGCGVTDGYGRTAYDWLAHFDRLAQLEIKYTPTSEAKRGPILKASVWKLSQRLLASNNRNDGLGFHELGHCLMFLGDTASARLCFQQQISGVADEETNVGKITHNVTCEGCQKSGSGFCGPRYVCTQCPDLDLCKLCRDEWTLCEGHEFLEINELPEGCLAEDIGPKIPATVREALKQFISLYSD